MTAGSPGLTMFVFRLKLAALAALVAAALLGTRQAQSHGGLSMEEDTCKLRVGRYFMHFVGYQPDSPRGPKEFCEDIPDTGHTIVVLDYLSDELRDLPAEVRIIRDTGSMQDLEAITVLHLPPKLYPSGSLNFEYEFSEPGKFVGLITVGTQEKMVSRFPFSVGRSRTWLDYLMLLLLIAALAAGLYRVAVVRRRLVKPAARS
jgi:hypothetical protein